MKKKSIIIFLLILLFTFLILDKYKEKQDYKLKLWDTDKSAVLTVKGIKGAQDFTFDDLNNTYICYKNYIQYLGQKGNSFVILKKDDLNMGSIEYLDNNLYITSDNNLLCFDLINKKLQVLIDDIPNFGDYNRSIIKIKDGKIYITIGSATNSGVVGDDNLWKKKYPYFYDISPINLILSGTNYGKNNQGPFMAENSKANKGQQISLHKPGNSEIITYDLKSGKIETYASGIRNVTGFDFNSKGNIIAGVGGMEFRGLRPVYGDKDYIYKIEKGKWYGFPDFSGGDEVKSPRFSIDGINNNLFVLENHPSNNPPAPIYQHKNVTSLGCLAADKLGVFEDIDDIYFYDIGENTIYKLKTFGVPIRFMAFNKVSQISSIKFFKDSIFILDEGKGAIYKIKNKG